MSEEFTIQCEQCGTTYIDIEEVCPYCGQPPTPPAADDDVVSEQPEPDPVLPEEEPLPPAQDDFFPEDEPLPYSDEEPVDEDYLPPPEEEYEPEDDHLEPVADDYLPEESLEPIEDDYGLDEPLPPADEYDPLGDDDIFAVEEQTWPREPDDYEPLYEGADEFYEPYPPLDEYDELELEEEEALHRPRKRRLILGCLGLLLFAGLFYGGIGLLGAYHGLQERVELTQVEAETHYQKGQEHLTEGSLELAIAEFERALNLNPNLLEAREALREAQRVSQSQPTPTSETRSAAAAEILAAAEEQMDQENWAEAAETLAQVRGLDSDYQPERISELLYTANYELGLELLTPNQIEEAVLAFERALAERADDPEITVELAKALLYIDGKNAEGDDYQVTVEAFDQLYQEDPGYLDVEQRLLAAYEAHGDELLNQEEWCQAEVQYSEAILLKPSAAIEVKAETADERCGQTSVAVATTTPVQPSARATSPAGDSDNSSTSNFGTTSTAENPISDTTSIEQPATAATGSIYFSAFNSSEARWEILAVPPSGGSPRVVVTEAIMPAVSPNGQWLIYRSEAIESEGLHRYDLTSGEDTRITIARQHILPRWGGDNTQFLFTAQEPATNRWLIYLGFADGKGDPTILRDGRTPDWSPNGSLVAYQGTDPEGNEPGIYLVPFNGGEPTRLTNHQSDRMPDFSPDGSQLAYMSTRNGNWDIYTVSAAGSAPRRITNSPGNDGLPAWSPDGSRLAYVSDAGGNWAIYVVSAGGGTPIRVTAWDGNRSDWLLAQIWWAR